MSAVTLRSPMLFFALLFAGVGLVVGVAALRSPVPTVSAPAPTPRTVARRAARAASDLWAGWTRAPRADQVDVPMVSERVELKGGSRVRPNSQNYRDLPVSSFNSWDTVGLVRQALDEIERGQFRAAAYLVDSMGRDDRISAVLEKRINGLLALPLEFTPPDDTAAAQEVADRVKVLWPRMAEESEIAQLHEWGVMLGLGVAEKIWDTNDSGEWVPRLKVWHPSFIYWRWDTRSYWLITEDGQIEIPEDGGGKWVVYAPRGYRYAHRKGKVRPLALRWLERSWTRRDWSRYDEIHGIPFKKAITPAAAEEKDKRAFVQDIANVGSEPVVECAQAGPDNKYDIELVEPKANNWEGFRSHLESADAALAITLLGQNLTTEGGGGKGGAYALGKVHQSVEKAIAAADATTMGRALQTMLLRDFAAYNYGNAELAPLPAWQVEPPEDKAETANALQALGGFLTAADSSGAPVNFRELLEEQGVPLLTPAEEALQKAEAAERAAQATAAMQQAGRQSGGKPGQDAPADQAEEPDPAKAKLTRKKGPRAQEYVDLLAGHAIAQGVAALAPDIRSLAETIATAGTFEEARGRILHRAGFASETRFVDLLQQSLLMTHLAGRAAVLGEAAGIKLAADGSGSDPSPDPAHFTSAIKAWRSRVPVTPAEWDALDAAARQRAFTVAGVVELDALNQAFAALDDAISKGTTLEDFKAAAGDALERAWGGEAPWRLQTVFRTNVQVAYSAGRYEMATNSAVLKRRPFWKYSAINDARTSPYCAPINGTILRADDPWWSSHYPPLHQLCRSSVITLTESAAADAGVTDEAPETAAADGFGGTPSLDWSPDLSGYPAPLLEAWHRAHARTS